MPERTVCEAIHRSKFLEELGYVSPTAVEGVDGSAISSHD